MNKKKEKKTHLPFVSRSQFRLQGRFTFLNEKIDRLYSTSYDIFNLGDDRPGDNHPGDDHPGDNHPGDV